tara:strand:- start:254 stop:517 length:264 start_codon:yes stop_codon:yes gene_type:complete
MQRSFSGIVERHKSIRLDYLKECGTPAYMVATGLIAGVVQHEYDHLDGVLFTDRMKEAFREKELSREEWENVVRRQYPETSYEIFDS